MIYKCYTIERTANTTPNRNWDYGAYLTEDGGEGGYVVPLAASMDEVQHLLDARTVIDHEVDGMDLTDWPDFSDAFYCFARWEDTDIPLTDDELEWLTREDSTNGILGDIARENYLER
jgi:hypothetical protein